MIEASEDSSISDQADPQEQQKITSVSVEHTNEQCNMSETHNATLDPEMEGEDNMDGNEDEELNEKKSKTAGGFTGRGVTLQMLLEDNILQPKEGAMSLEYMGQKFNGDLLADGKIFSAEVQEVFSSPSAWALRCKKIVNPEQKYGCGWSSVRYCGRPLDVYKNQWMRKRRLEQVSDNSTPDDCNLSTNEPVLLEPEPVIQMSMKQTVGDRQIIKHETLGNRTSIEDPNLLVEAISFANIGKLQPFLISLNTTALVVMDVHCSLTRSEVVGYLAGQWDINTNTLTIKQAFPCLNRVTTDDKRGQATEIKIAQSIESAGLCLVGWYHSHPLSPPTPTVQDIDSQLEYQLKLKGTGDQGYRPCVAMISSPFHHAEPSQSTSTTHLTCYWVSPPTESRPLELGRPMAMQYNVVYDATVKDDVVPKLEACLKFYRDSPDRTNFDENWSDELTILDKLKATLKSSLQSEDDVIIDLVDTLSNMTKVKTKTDLTDVKSPAEPIDPEPQNNLKEISCM
ncbi:MPN domain-containing protein-like isoform X2 [Daphnia pulex]|uniref:MPN domain-containing protein-like isoform X2 n=1 Tax=Daphnia pulex TaxID=6669 RepID=UPI001EDF405E|nr:MPN domain-containing protein-like isoform X2 [Daphnia pulex]XP_046464580.1 MPN domain-containing protein-like isoform X2 [Daphnia pulex]